MRLWDRSSPPSASALLEANIDWSVEAQVEAVDLSRGIAREAEKACAAAMTSNINLVWRSSPPWFAKLWSVALGGACLTVVWVAAAYKLISLNVNY